MGVSNRNFVWQGETPPWEAAKQESNPATDTSATDAAAVADAPKQRRSRAKHKQTEDKT